MSFYNMLNGVNPAVFSFLPGVLGMHPSKISRFRDAAVAMDENNVLTFYVLTRTGGNNRAEYPNEILTSHKGFLRTEDVDEDNTYARYYFEIPFAEELRKMEKGTTTKDIIGADSEMGKHYREAMYEVFPKLTQRFNDMFNLDVPIPEGVEQVEK